MICKICNLNKDKTFYSHSQLKKKERTCKDCQNCQNNDFKTFTLEKQKILFNNLIEWLRNNGAIFPDVEIKHYNERFRGIVATRNIFKNKQIVKIPHKCIMTTFKAYESDIGLEIKKSGWEPNSPHTLLALMLLQEKLNPNSFWKPFIDILPPNYNDFPQFYSNNELLQLKGSFVLDMIQSRNLNLENEFKEMTIAIPDFCKKISLKDFIWARIAIVSRVFYIAYTKEKTTQGIVPMADMLNHSKNPGTRWTFVPEEDSFIIYSEKYIFKNIEIFDTYGPKCNSRYFVNYGFTLKDNQEYNQGAIFIDPVKILNKYTMNENKLNLLKNMETTIDDSFCNYGCLIESKKETLVSINKCFRFQFIILSDKKVDSQPKTMTGLHSIWCLFGMLRLLLSSDEEFIKITHTKESKDFIQILLSISPLSTENELSVLKELSSICNESLTNFDTTLEMDEKELETVEPYSNRWNILNILIGEKRVLIYYRDLGLYVNSFNEYHKIGRNLRKHNMFSSYYKVYWEHFLK